MKEIDRIVQIKSNNLSPSKGRLLISEPFMGDQYFKRSVILIIEHNEEGSFGVVLNNSIPVNINDIIKDFPPIKSKIFLGGPIDTNSTFYIHTLGDKITNSLEISSGLYWGGDIEIVKEMIFLNQLDATNIRFFAGYSGWALDQINMELKRNSWLVHKKVDNSILKYPAEKMWSLMINDMGPKYQHWTKFPIDPNMN